LQAIHGMIFPAYTTTILAFKLTLMNLNSFTENGLLRIDDNISFAKVYKNSNVIC